MKGTHQMPKYENFEEWMDEIEVFSVRAERFQHDVYQANPEIMIEWLEQAWHLGAASSKEEQNDE